MKERIKQLLDEVSRMTAANAEELEALRIKYLSKKGEISQLFNDFRNVANEDKREVGQLLNQLKNAAQAQINTLKEHFANQQETAQYTDLTRTAEPVKLGTRHPLSLVREEIIDIFGRIGFTVAEGPEIEDDWHVFSALNFPPEHPARDMQDTFFVERHANDVLLRTHTSSVQVRTMLRQQPPIRMVFPGRVYRNEAISYRAHCFFHQVEGLYVDTSSKPCSTSPRKCSARRQKSAYARHISRLPSRARRWISPASFAAAKAALSASTPVGWKYSGAAWWIPTCYATAALTRTCIQVTPSAWA